MQKNYRDTLITAVKDIQIAQDEIFTNMVCIGMANYLSDLKFEEGEVKEFEVAMFEDSGDANLDIVIELLYRMEEAKRSLMNLNTLKEEEIEMQDEMENRALRKPLRECNSYVTRKNAHMQNQYSKIKLNGYIQFFDELAIITEYEENGFKHVYIEPLKLIKRGSRKKASCIINEASIECIFFEDENVPVNMFNGFIYDDGGLFVKGNHPDNNSYLPITAELISTENGYTIKGNWRYELPRVFFEADLQVSDD